MSHYKCQYCGGPATWYCACCWRCAKIARLSIEIEAKKAAERVAKVFADALDNPTEK